MKQLFLYFILISSSFPILGFSELQRLAITPQTIGITAESGSGTLQTLCIDYDRDIPNWLNTIDAPAYDQVYSDSDVSIKINGKETDRSFSSLVQSENPLLLLNPTSYREVIVKLNPSNPESETIKELILEFKGSSVIGNLKEHRDIRQSKAIFENWGYNIPQYEFWERAQILDLINSNKEIDYNSKADLQLKNLCDNLYQKIDLFNYDFKTFKRLVEENLIKLDDRGVLTAESTEFLDQLTYYEKAISKAKSLNEYSEKIEQNKAYFEQVSEDQVAELITAQKQSFYSTSDLLTDLNAKNENILDTLINGKRHVLMVAWKSQGFLKYINDEKGQLSTYQSDKEFFKYPLFLTTKADLQNVVSESNLKNLDKESCRTRFKQALGLPPQSTNDVFVEFWVDEKSLFRPSVDSSLNSSLMMKKLSSTYIKKLAEFSYGSYKNETLLEKYPFTGLGYTWDYSPSADDNFGVSEFVLKENKIIYVRKKVETGDYVKTFQ